jgi:hypothetical protein
MTGPQASVVSKKPLRENAKPEKKTSSGVKVTTLSASEAKQEKTPQKNKKKTSSKSKKSKKKKR